MKCERILFPKSEAVLTYCHKNLNLYLELNKQKDLPDEPVITGRISRRFRAQVIALYKFYVSTIKSFLPVYADDRPVL